MNAWDTLGNPGRGRHDIKPYLCKFHQASEPSNSIREFFMRIETTRKIRAVVDQSRYLSENLFMLFHGAWMDTFSKLGYLQEKIPSELQEHNRLSFLVRWICHTYTQPCGVCVFWCRYTASFEPASGGRRAGREDYSGSPRGFLLSPTGCNSVRGSERTRPHDQ